MSGELLPLLLVGPVLAAAIGFDLSTRMIPMVLTGIAGALIALLHLLDWPPVELIPRVVAAMVGFWFAFALYTARRATRDGVAFATVLILYIPPVYLPLYLLTFGVTFAFLAWGLVALRRAAPRLAEESGIALADMAFLGTGRTLPLGLATAVNGLVFPWAMLVFGA